MAYRRIAENFKIGAGYNFTSFSDDLTDLEYDHRGWFINIAGYYWGRGQGAARRGRSHTGRIPG
ncbi:hypothetical protein [Luteimonas sp. A649]